MKARLIDLAIGADGKQRLTISVDDDARLLWDELHDKDVEISIKQFRKKRSLDANAYFHVLCNKIARVLGVNDACTKRHLNLDYGQVATDNNGMPVCVMLPSGVETDNYYPYMKPYNERIVNGTRCTCYMLYKRTHELNSAEMAHLIQGAVDEAKALGIETLSPKELESLLKTYTEVKR